MVQVPDIAFLTETLKTKQTMIQMSHPTAILLLKNEHTRLATSPPKPLDSAAFHARAHATHKQIFLH